MEEAVSAALLQDRDERQSRQANLTETEAACHVLFYIQHYDCSMITNAPVNTNTCLVIPP